MAWYKRYEVPFGSFRGDQYVVRIYEQTSGTSVTLTGAAEPFVTQEDATEDIFTPMRTQTGYLRVLDTINGNLLETLMPQNNTEKLVRLYFNPGTNERIVWQGFLQAEAYTQPWDNQQKVLEFPVKSLLGALADVTIDTNFAASTKNFAWYIVHAFTNLSETPLSVKVITNVASVVNMLSVEVDASLFFDEDEQNNEGSSVKVQIGHSYREILEEIAKLFGVCLRMLNGVLYICMYDDSAGTPRLSTLTWQNLSDIASGSTIVPLPNTVSDVVLLDEAEFEGVDNVVEFVQGAKEAIVRLNINEQDADIIEMPMTDEDASTTYEIVRTDAGHEGEQVITKGQVFVQPHSPRSNTIETFNFYEYQCSGDNYTLIGTSNYANCLANCVIMRPLFNPFGSTSDHLHTGAFPCRWLYKKDTSSQPQLKSGMFFNQYFMRGGSYTPNYCYKIKSNLSQNLRGGYLHLDMKCLNFMRGQLAADKDLLYFGQYTGIWGSNKTTYLYLILTFGSYEWNGTEWVAHSGNYNTFELTFDGENIKSNKTTEMSVDESEGFFIPVPADGLSGNITLYITNASKCQQLNDQGQVISTYDAHSRIITDLALEYLPEIDPMASRRTTNTYRQTILSSGFAGNAERELSVGTNNNNIPSNSFIRDGWTLIESLPYYYGAGDVRYERPEKNLLARMVAHFGEVRRAFTGVLQQRFNASATWAMYDVLYTYLGRKFFGVEKQRNWRDDRGEVKFIEIVGSGISPQNPQLSWSADSAKVRIGGTNTFPTLNNPHNLSVTYSSSDTSVATVDSSGVVTLIAAGSATISAVWTGDEDYYASTVSYALSVQLYDAEVCYLECDGNQHIITDLIPQQNNFRVVARMANTSSGVHTLFVVYNPNSAYYFNWLGYNNNDSVRYLGYDKKVTITYNDHIYEVGNGSISVDGVVKHTVTPSMSFVGNTEPLCLLTYKSQSGYGSKFVGKFYFLKAYYGNTLIADYIPVRIGSVGYIYDKVSGHLFANDGTGNFALGPDIDAKPYDADVEYIEATGGARINTNFVPVGYNVSIKTRMLISSYASGTYNYWFGSHINDTYNSYRFIRANASTTNVIYNFGTKSSQSIEVSLNEIHTIELYADASNQYCNLDGTVYSRDRITGSENTNAIQVFTNSINLSGITNGRVYYFEIYCCGIKVRDLIPVRIGTTGYMYDRVSGTLFGNAGTGDFILGPDK